MEADRCTEEAESSDETDDGADHAAGRLGNVDWCSCDGCRIMPTVEESLCCRENEPAVSKMESMQHPSCRPYYLVRTLRNVVPEPGRIATGFDDNPRHVEKWSIGKQHTTPTGYFSN